MADPYKVRENRLRRMAARQGLRYRVSRRRDRLAADYGRVWLTDARTGAVVADPTFIKLVRTTRGAADLVQGVAEVFG